MDITFNCSGCGQHIAIDEAGAGMSVQCPNCGQSLTVPNASTTNLARIPITSGQIDSTAVYTLFRGRGPAKPTQIFGAKYFYRTPEQKVEGPLNKLEMRALMRKKVVEPETMILCPVSQEWLPCERFPELPKPAYNKLLHFEKDTRFSTLTQEIPQKIVEHIGNKIGEAELKEWLVKRIQECGYKCPDYDEGTINDLVYEDRIKVIVSTNRQTWFGYLRFVQQGGSALTNKPVLIGF